MGVAMLRTGYKTRVRPWRDAPGDVEIRWYKCPPGALALPYPSLFRSLHWEAYPYLFDNAKGEVFNAPVTVYPYKSPPGVTGRSACGTVTDFSRGGHFDPVAPPYPRGDDGIAECCRPPLGCLLVDGMGTGPPGYVSIDNSTQAVVSDGSTVFGPVAANTGLSGVEWVFNNFIVTDTSAVFWIVTPGTWIQIPLASRDEGLTWELFWANGGVITGFAATGPVHHTDEFLLLVPPGCDRIIIAQVGGAFLSTALWQAAPHVVPPPPP